MKNFRDLRVWEKAHGLTLKIYDVSSKFPSTEIYGLVSQMRRASSSIATNIAEGCGRNGDAELARFLNIAMGSASEVEYQILLAHDLGYIDKTIYAELTCDITEIKKMLSVFIRRLRANN